MIKLLRDIQNSNIQRIVIDFGKSFFIAILTLATFRPINFGDLQAQTFWGVFRFNWLDQLFSLCIVVSFAALLMLMIFRKYIFSFTTFSIIIMAIFSAIAAFLNSQNPIFIKLYLPALTLAMITDFYFKKKWIREYLSALTAVLSAYVIVNLFTIFIYPQGMYSVFNGIATENGYWVLGWKKTYIFWELVAVMMAAIRSFYLYKRITFFPIALLGLSIFTSLLVGATTSFGGLVIALVLYLFISRKPLNKFLNSFVLVALSVVYFLAIVIFRLQQTIPHFFENLFGKTSTLSGRTTIWDSVFSQLREHFVLGLGVYDLRISPTVVVTAHSNYLNLIVYGGIFVLATYLLLQVKFAFDLSLSPNEITTRILLSCGISLFVVTATDTAFLPALILPILLASKFSPAQIKIRKFTF